MTTTARVLAFIISERQRTGLSPDTRAIAAACGLSTSSAAAYHIAKLEAAGLVTVARGQARGVVPTAERRVYLEDGEKAAKVLPPVERPVFSVDYSE